MPSRPAQLIKRTAGALAGWPLLVAGMGLLAVVLLTPIWVQCRRLVWQEQVLAARAHQARQQADRCRHVLGSLESGDPILLERLAYSSLNLKPAGARVVPDQPQPVAPPATSRTVADELHPAPLGRDLGPVITWLSPASAEQVAPFQPPDSIMVTLATGPARFLLVGLAACCIMVGLLPGTPIKPTG